MIQISQDTINTIQDDPLESKEDTYLPLFETLNENETIPTQQTSDSVGYDVTTIQNVTTMPQQRKILRTGLKINSPVNQHSHIALRSGLASKGIHV